MEPKTNVIFEYKKFSVKKLLFDQFKSPLIYVLLISGFVTFLLNEYYDTLIIIITVFVNTALGFFQEYRAQNTLHHLKKLLKSVAVVIRDDKRFEIDAEYVNVNDIALVSKEFNIPADGILVAGKDIFVNEAILTGESYPVKKNVGDKLYVGTSISMGIGKMKIEQVGKQTEVGKIGKHILTQEDKQTPLQKQILHFSKILTISIIILSVIVFIIGVINGYELETLIKTSIAIAIAAIPEGLVITVTVILTVGMERILKKQAVVRKLLAAETLGSVSIICVDKTGTLTEGRLTTSKVDFVDPKLGFISLKLCNNQIDPLEVAMNDLYLSEQNPLSKTETNELLKSRRLDSIGFSNEHKFTATLNEINGKNYLFVFGAHEGVLNRTSSITKEEKQSWDDKIKAQGEEAKKVLAFAYKIVDKDSIKLDDVQGLVWNGIVSFHDPVRKDISTTVKQLIDAGIRIKMITGDYIHTAIAVAEEAGITDQIDNYETHHLRDYVLTGDQIKELPKDDLIKMIEKCIIFTRIDPMQKYQIVEALKHQGYIVAMTGDGVNDAPALKKADVGIVVNEASDVSKNTADMVLLNSDLKTIAFAVKTGRIIFENIRKVIMYLVSGSFSEITLIVFAFIFKMPVPLNPLQILWINMAEDTLPALALAYEKDDNGIMNLKPRGSKEKIVNKKIFRFLLSVISISSLLIIIYYVLLASYIPDIKTLQTVIFVSFGIESLIVIFSIRNYHLSIFKHNPFDNWRLDIAVLVGVLLYIAAINLPFLNELLGIVPIGLDYVLLSILLGIGNVILIEIVKKIVRL